MTTLTTEQDARVFLQGRSRSKLTGQREKLILQAARERLEATRIYELTRLHCEVQDEVLVILGTVSSFYFKQLAQEAVKSMPGIRWILNQTEVVDRVDRNDHDLEIETATRSRDLMRSKKAK
jgi:osmotically-inducible protein OsmY